MPQSIGPEADLSVAASCCCQSREKGALRMQLLFIRKQLLKLQHCVHGFFVFLLFRK
jgi:hypothetical protein